MYNNLIEEDIIVLDNEFFKINVMFETVNKIYDIKMKELEYNYIYTENVDIEFVDLYMEAENTKTNKQQGLLSRMFTAILNFIRSIRAKILRLFGNDKKAAELEDKIKGDPTLSNQTVEIVDSSDSMKAINDGTSFFGKLIDKIIGGKATEKDADEAEKREESLVKILMVAAASYGVGAMANENSKKKKISSSQLIQEEETIKKELNDTSQKNEEKLKQGQQAIDNQSSNGNEENIKAGKRILNCFKNVTSKIGTFFTNRVADIKSKKNQLTSKNNSNTSDKNGKKTNKQETTTSESQPKNNNTEQTNDDTKTNEEQASANKQNKTKNNNTEQTNDDTKTNEEQASANKESQKEETNKQNKTNDNKSTSTSVNDSNDITFSENKTIVTKLRQNPDHFCLEWNVQINRFDQVTESDIIVDPITNFAYINKTTSTFRADKYTTIEKAYDIGNNTLIDKTYKFKLAKFIPNNYSKNIIKGKIYKDSMNNPRETLNENNKGNSTKQTEKSKENKINQQEQSKNNNETSNSASGTITVREMFNIVKKLREKYNEGSSNITPLCFSVAINHLNYQNIKDERNGIDSALYLKSSDGTVYPNRIGNFSTRYLDDDVYTIHSGLSSINDPDSRVKLAKVDDMNNIIGKGEFFQDKPMKYESSSFNLIGNNSTLRNRGNIIMENTKVLNFIDELEQERRNEVDNNRFKDSISYKYNCLNNAKKDGVEECLSKSFEKFYLDAIPLNDEYKTANHDDSC